MSEAMDPKIEKYLETMTEDIGTRVEDRRKDKWPDYRETDSSAKKREILIHRHQRMAVRWARVWVPIGSDREIRACEKVVEAYLERIGEEGTGGGSEESFRRTLQGLTNLGNSLARVLRSVQGGNRDSRMAAVERVATAVQRGDSTAQILADAHEYQPRVQMEEADDQDVRD